MSGVLAAPPTSYQTQEPLSGTEVDAMLTQFARITRESLESYSCPDQTSAIAWKRVVDHTVLTAKSDARVLFSRSRDKWPSYLANETRDVVWSLQTKLLHNKTVWPDRYELTYTLSLERVPVALEPLAEVLTASKMLVVRKKRSERRINLGN